MDTQIEMMKQSAIVIISQLLQNNIKLFEIIPQPTPVRSPDAQRAPDVLKRESMRKNEFLDSS